MKTKGLALVPDLKTFYSVAKERNATIFLVPSKLRLVRTTLGDNGFSGVRTLTFTKGFVKDFAQDSTLNESMQDIKTAEEAEEKVSAILDGLREGEHLIVSSGGSAKYIVCNPNDFFAVAVLDNIVSLCPTSEKAFFKRAGKNATGVVKTSFASFV